MNISFSDTPEWSAVCDRLGLAPRHRCRRGHAPRAVWINGAIAQTEANVGSGIPHGKQTFESNLNMFECGDASALQIVNTWHMITVWSILKLLDGQLVDNQSILWSYPTASILRCQCIRCLRHNFRLALVQSQYLSSAKMRREFLPNWRGFNVFRNQQKSFPSACGLGYPD